MLIKNFATLATTPLRKQALLIAEAGLQKIVEPSLLRQHLSFQPRHQTLSVRGKKFNLSAYQRIFIMGFGRGASQIVAEIQQAFPGHISGGLVIDTVPRELKNIISKVGIHPGPNIRNIAATQELLNLLASLTATDLVICVISGSSLLAYPANLSPDQEREIMSALAVAGATAEEINIVRKHLSKVYGGHLAKIAWPATMINLIYSDVAGDDLGLIAHGPTIRDQSTVHDAASILRQHQIMERCHTPFYELTETPKEDKYFVQVHNILLGSTADAVTAMRHKADDLGLQLTVGNLPHPVRETLGANEVALVADTLIDAKGEDLLNIGALPWPFSVSIKL